MKHFFSLFLIYTFFSANAQIAHYNNFPTLIPIDHILDDKLDNISFAYSMRLLNSEYEGPLVKLRTSCGSLGQNTCVKDFYPGDNDIVDVNAVNNWANGYDIYIERWYDQSGLNRDAIQETLTSQPKFFADPIRPYFEGDGLDDYLEVFTPNGLQDVTNQGKEGSVLFILKTANRNVNQVNFGVIDGSGGSGLYNRWTAFINRSNNSVDFDPGRRSGHSFDNTDNLDFFKQYTFIRTTDSIYTKAGDIIKTTASNRPRAVSELNFQISAAADDNNRANTPFIEFIMYKTGLSSNLYEEIGANQIAFWNL